MAYWEEEAYVFKPNRDYALKIKTKVNAVLKVPDVPSFSPTPDQLTDEKVQTAYVFFRTEGPPGLVTLSPPAESEASELNHLSLYVQQTLPPTVPGKGEKPQMFRPIYRAYDIGIEFNVDYVATMYSMASRDLSLYLFDSNDQPVRDRQGRLMAIDTLWDPVERNLFDDQTQTLIEQANACTSIDIEKITRPIQATACDYLMEADTVYEVRIIPLFLCEDFSSGELDSWQAIDHGSGSSSWEINSELTTPELPESENNPRSFFVRQTSTIGDNTAADSNQFQLGTVLIRRADRGISEDDDHPDHPKNWTDYRFQAQVRTSEDDFIGLVCRYQDSDPDNYYLFALGRGVRRLIRGLDGTHQILMEEPFSLALDTDYRITIEAIGSTLAIYQDGVPVFKVDDQPLLQGSVGLYCAHNPTARFSDLRVDDLRKTAPVLYRFAFTTSWFTNFYHQLHSYNDESWSLELEESVNLPISEAISLDQLQNSGWPSTSQAEVRKYEELIVASSVLRETDQRVINGVEVSRLTQQGNTIGFFISSPEPINWRRTSLEVFHAPSLLDSSPPSDAVKLTEIHHDPSDQSKESMALLLRKPYNLSEHRIEMWALAGPISPQPVRQLFDGKPDFDAAIIFIEKFGPSALDRYRVLDEGTSFGPSRWQSSATSIIQTSRIFSGALDRHNLAKTGTMALVGAPNLRDIYIRVALSTAGAGDIGLAFRIQDIKNYYRFSSNRRWGYLRLVKVVNGQFKLLWEKTLQPAPNKTHSLEIIAQGDYLSGRLDGEGLFDLRDRSHAQGQVGLYSWYNANARFEALRIEDANEYEYFGSSRRIGPWKIIEERCQLLRSSPTSRLSPSVNLNLKPARLPFIVHKHAIVGKPDWDNYRLKVSGILSSDRTINLLFRYRDTSNFYQFEVGAEPSSLRLLCRSNGSTRTLVQTQGQLPEEEPISILVDVVGDRITTYVNDQPIFDVQDATHSHGQAGLAYRASLEPDIESFTVTTVPLDGIALFSDRFAQENADEWVDLNTHDEWEIHDSGSLEAPSQWQIYQGALWQRSNIHSDPPADDQAPNKLGTHAIAGNPEWTDYVLSVQVCSDDGDAVGVVFRHQDEDNYYRFSMDAQGGYRQLVKRVNGHFHVLWQDVGIASPAYELGRTYQLVITVEGSLLRGYLDEIPLFIVEDPDLATGKVGLYTWFNNIACFSQVRVYPLMVLYLLHQRIIKALDNWKNYPPILVPREDSGITLRRDNIRPYPGFMHFQYHDIEEVEGWNDYRLSMRFVSDVQTYGISIYFRCTDENDPYCVNSYYVNVDPRQKQLSLHKTIDGATEVLQIYEVQEYQNGKDYILTIDCIADLISVYLDSVRLIALRDRALATGKVRLSYSWRSFLGIHHLPPPIFTYFEAIHPTWVEYHKFSIAKDLLPEGSCVIIHHPESTAPYEIAGTVLREADDVSPHLGNDIADLRLVDKAGNVLDSKRSLPQTDFSEVSLKALRNADGTKFLLLPNDKTSLTPGTYRLKFTYRRELGNKLPRFSQSGDRSNEEATINIPWVTVI